MSIESKDLKEFAELAKHAVGDINQASIVKLEGAKISSQSISEFKQTLNNIGVNLDDLTNNVSVVSLNENATVKARNTKKMK